MQDDVPEKHVVVAVLLLGKWDDSRQDPRDLNDGDVGAQVLSALQFDDHVEALVEKLRKRMSRIDREGRKHRVDALRKEIRKVFLLALWHVGIRVKAESLLLELRLKLVAPARVLIIDHPPDSLADCGKRIASRQAVRPCFKRVHLLLLFQPRNAHFEKFVQIGG